MPSNYLAKILAGLAAVGLLTACQPDSEQPAPKPTGPSRNAALQPPPKPPTPPLFEDFEGAPKLSLFPRIGDYRPENDDEVGLPFYDAYLEHLVRTAGIVGSPDGRRAFLLRSVAKLDSVGFFSPVAVEPNSRYRISARFKADLPEGGQAGLGILEFDQFLWVAEQYPRTLAEQHQTGMQPGLELTGALDWQTQSFEITTGPRTRMVHLVFYREGTEDRSPSLVDDIEMVKVE
jgi:hypothetical protein